MRGLATGLLVTSAILGCVLLLCEASPIARASPDSVVPEEASTISEETELSWKEERDAVLKSDSKMLQRSDKAMFAALTEQKDDQASPQWARYLRHKGMRPASEEGHKWTHNDLEVTGALIETTAKSGNSEKLCDKNVEQHHGYFKLSGGQDKNYFYWLFEARHPEENDGETPLVLWLTGGPGCSSELALFTENGPCKVRSDGESTRNNPFSWNRKSHLIFVDQPAGTGFSYGAGEEDVDTREPEISKDLFHFMQELVKKYPQYHRSPFYVFGESYAGHFVPATGGAILEGNLGHDGEYIALKGIGIGNGLTDPEVQYPYYPQMAFNSDTTPAAITKDQYKRMEGSIDQCVGLIRDCKKENDKCKQAFVQCNADLIDPVQETQVDVYDLRKPCEVLPLCGDYSHVKKYLSSEKVVNTLGVKKGIQWTTCNFGINSMFHVDWMHSQVHHIPPMLKNGLQVLVYAGDVDFICNWMGNKAWTLQMDWPGKEGFNKAQDMPWMINGKEVGKERRFEGLSFVQVHEAGHMVPEDQPAVSMEMLESFLRNQALVPAAADPTSPTSNA